MLVCCRVLPPCQPLMLSAKHRVLSLWSYMPWPGIELQTSQSYVRHSNHKVGSQSKFLTRRAIELMGLECYNPIDYQHFNLLSVVLRQGILLSWCLPTKVVPVVQAPSFWTLISKWTLDLTLYCSIVYRPTVNLSGILLKPVYWVIVGHMPYNYRPHYRMVLM